MMNTPFLNLTSSRSRMYFPGDFPHLKDSAIINFVKQSIISEHFKETTTRLTQLKIKVKGSFSLVYKIFSSVITQRDFWIHIAQVIVGLALVTLSLLTTFFALKGVSRQLLTSLSLFNVTNTFLVGGFIFLRNFLFFTPSSLFLMKSSTQFYHFLEEHFTWERTKSPLVSLEITPKSVNSHLKSEKLLNEKISEDSWYEPITYDLLSRSRLKTPLVTEVDNYVYDTFVLLKTMFGHSLQETQNSTRFIYSANSLKMHHPIYLNFLTEKATQQYIQDMCDRFCLTPEQFIECWNIPLSRAYLSSGISPSLYENEKRRHLRNYINESRLDNEGIPFFVRRDEVLGRMDSLQRGLKFVALAPPELAPFLSQKCLLETHFELLEKLKNCDYLSLFFPAELLKTHHCIVNKKELKFEWVKKDFTARSLFRTNSPHSLNPQFSSLLE